MSYSIGALSFDDLQGNFELPGMQRDTETKTGDDGVSVFNTGRRSAPFAVETRYAFTTWALARAAEINYANAFGAGAVNVVVGGVGYTGTGIQFIVLGPPRTRIVSMPAYQSTARGNVSPAFVVFAEWRLQAVEV